MASWQWVPPGAYIRDEPPVVLEPTTRPRYRRRLVSDHHTAGQQYGYHYEHPGMYVSDDGLGVHRPRSATGRAPPSPGAVVINNHLTQEEIPIRGRPVSMAVPHFYDPHHNDAHCGGHSRGRSHSRRRSVSRSREASPYELWEKTKENERMREQLEAFRKQKEKEAEEERIKTELLLKKVREEEKQREEERRRREIEDQAVAEWARKERERVEREKKERDEQEARRKEIEAQAILEHERKEREKIEKEKAEAERREKEYRERLKKDFDLTDQQLEKVLSRERKSASSSSSSSATTKTTTTTTTTGALDITQKTYMKIARKHISLETLRHFNLPYKLDDADPQGYVLVKRWVPEHVQDRLWDHTRRIREERELLNRRIEMTRLADQKKSGGLGLGVEIRPNRKKSLRSKSPGLVRWLG